MPTTNQKPVKQFAEELKDAYSTSRYRRGWGPCIKMLRKRGMNDELIEAVIRSKFTRWAADAARSDRYGCATSEDLKRALTDTSNTTLARLLDVVI